MSDSDPIISSSPVWPQPADNHFGDGETIATQPLDRPYVPPSRTPTSAYPTQPTQTVRTPPKSATQLSQIQVPGSSPSSPPTAPMYRPQQQSRPQPQFRPYQPPMHNPMAPPGTFVRPPVFPQHTYNPSSQSQAQTQFSDFGDPDGPVSDSEDELNGPRPGDIPPSFINGRTVQQDQFKASVSAFSYNPHAQRINGLIPPQKRPADDTVSAYGNVSRPAKQPRTEQPRALAPAPSRPHKVARPKITTIADIPDFTMRTKAQMISGIMSHCSVPDILHALEVKKGNVDDAIDYLMDGSARQNAKEMIDLTGEEDAEGSTDSDVEVITTKPTANRNAEAQKAGLAAYSRLQQQKKAQPEQSPRKLDSTPPRKPLNRLKPGIRPDRSRSSSVQPSGARKPARRVIEDDDDEEDDANGHATEDDPEVTAAVRQSVDDKVFDFLGKCTEQELVSMIDCKPEDAEFLLSKRPFKTLDGVRRVNRPAVPGKRKGGNQRAVGDRLVDQLMSTEESLQAVDRVVDRCQSYRSDVQRELKSIGIDVSRVAKEDGLNLASFDESDKDSVKVDSGTGTPTPGTNPRVQQPSIMSKDRTLKDYQLVGLNWLNVMYSLRRQWARQNGCILADEMGLGKTYQVIAFLTHLYQSGEQGKHLIVVPSSTLENWLREFQLFSPDVHVEPYYGKAAVRKDQQWEIEQAGDSVKVIITTYQIAASDKDNAWLRKMKFASCIFDEGHKLKNAKSKGYRALYKIKAGFRLFLTGTPLQNNLQELISVLAFIMPTLFEDAEDDLQLIFDCKAKTTDADHAALLAFQRTSRAKEMLKPFILRRTKDQVLKDLPAKTNRLVYCDMTPAQKDVYDGFTKIHEQALADRRAGKKIDESGKFPHLQDRRSAAIHPLLRRTHYTNDDIDLIVPKIDKKGRPWGGKSNITIFEELTWASDWDLHEICVKYKIKKPGPFKNNEWMDSGKIAKLIELLREHKASGSRTLIFSQYSKVLDILGKVLETEDVTHVRLDGTTPTDTRLALIDKFNGDPSIQAFMITTRAGGAGINLATADKVIIVDPSFNPQDDVQAANRAHRIGQTRPVEVVTLVTKNTIEEQIYKLGLSKLALDQRVAGAEDDEGESGGSSKVDTANMKRIEDMLMKGQTTPPEQEEEEANETEKVDITGDMNKQEKAVAGEEKEVPVKDAKDAFKDAMKAKGVELADD